MTRIALIAHDDEKPEMIDFAATYESYLEGIELVTTGTTGERIQEEVGLDVERKESGPMGGDLQIGGEVAEEDFGRRARDALGHPVVFGDPEPRVAETLGLLGRLHRVRVGVGRSAALGDGREVDDREVHVPTGGVRGKTVRLDAVRPPAGPEAGPAPRQSSWTSASGAFCITL